jgi:hypothetical protein
MSIGRKLEAERVCGEDPIACIDAAISTWWSNALAAASRVTEFHSRSRTVGNRRIDQSFTSDAEPSLKRHPI